MIFSIIIIIASVAVAFYVIKEFLSVNECAGIGSFYDDFQKQVTKAWSSTISKGVYDGNLPASIDYVCFANPGKVYTGTKFKVQYDSLKDTIQSFGVDENRNVFLYPSKGCQGMEYYSLEHIVVDDFFCSSVVGGKVKVNFNKDVSDALVKLS
jgi:hypothetical protein